MAYAVARPTTSSFSHNFNYNSTVYTVPKACTSARTSQSELNILSVISSCIKNMSNSLTRTYTKTGADCDYALKIVYVGSEAPQVKKDLVLERLNQISQLESDWNGYGASGFSATLISHCASYIHALPVLPDVYPTGRRSIQFQYELSDRSYLEFEISDTKIVYLIVPQRKYANAVFGELGISDIEKMKEIVNSFYGRNCRTK